MGNKRNAGSHIAMAQGLFKTVRATFQEPTQLFCVLTLSTHNSSTFSTSGIIKFRRGHKLHLLMQREQLFSTAMEPEQLSRRMQLSLM